MRIYQQYWSLAVACSALVGLASLHSNVCLAQTDESTPHSRTAKLIEAAKLNFGYIYQDGAENNSEASPIATQTQEINVAQAPAVNSDPRLIVNDAANPPVQTLEEASGRDQDAIAPVQSRSLNVRVQTVSTSFEKLGTGLYPTPSASRDLGSQPLPLGMTRGMFYTHVCWKASLIQHYPLYFEDAMLERHGHARCWHGCALPQSVVSGVKFFATIPLLPYHETLRPKHKCVYALGHYRPGSPAPCLRDNIPYDGRAFAVESASAAAFFWATPL